MELHIDTSVGFGPLEAPETNVDNGRALMLSTIELAQPEELYRRADDNGRRLLNKAIFDRLHIDHDGG